MDKLVPIGIMAALIAANALFVMAEFAIIGAPTVVLRRRAEQGDTVAAAAARIQSDPKLQDRFIAAAQLGITAASLGLGMYGEHLLAEWLLDGLEGLGMGGKVASHALASVLAVALLTYFHVVLGEMIPKSLALQEPIRTVQWITPPVRLFQRLTYPVVIALNGVGNGILRLFGVRRSESADRYRTTEEIEQIVRESEAGGELNPTSAALLRELIDFGELDAAEVMVPRVRVAALEVGSGPEQVRRMLAERPHTRYPVFRNDLDHVTGAVHVKDLLRLLREERPLTGEDVHPVPFVAATTPLEGVLMAMRRARSQLAVVMDEHGGAAGIVTPSDLFEEVVGEIEDEVETPELRQADDGTVRARGTARVAEVGEWLKVPLRHPEVDTVSGLILALLDRPAEVGDEVVYDGVRFRVTEVAGRGVGESLVELVEDGE